MSFIDSETVRVHRPSAHVGIVEMNRPEAANALNTQMGRDLLGLWSGLYSDVEDLRCIVLTGHGERVFCAGGDLKERNNMTDAEWQHQHALFEQAMMAQLDCPVPVIAAVNGAAFGGGLEFILACDFAYGVSSARFALTEVTLGIMPGACGTQNLPRAVGVRRAKEIVLTGRAFSADEALAWGILNGVCEADVLMETVLDVADAIAENGPIAVRQAKKSLDMGTHLDRHSGYMFEIEAYNRMVPTEDRLEGVRAFNEKRKPQFKGR